MVISVLRHYTPAVPPRPDRHGCQEELHPHAMEGARRGYNVLPFERPGQGDVIRVQQIPFRPDRENVIGPVVGSAVSRPDVDEDRIIFPRCTMISSLHPFSNR